MHYLICYRLHTPGKEYDELYSAIKNISGTYWHNTTSSWIIRSSLSTSGVFGVLKPHIDSNDELAVFRLSGSYSGQLKPDDLKWLREEPGLSPE